MPKRLTPAPDRVVASLQAAIAVLAIAISIGLLASYSTDLRAQAGDFNPFEQYAASSQSADPNAFPSWADLPTYDYSSSSSYNPFGYSYSADSSSVFVDPSVQEASTSSATPVLPAPMPASSLPLVTHFTDVDERTLEGMAAAALGQQGVVRGFEDGTLRPGDPLTRAQAVKLLIKMKIPQDPTSAGDQHFSDVPSDGQWYVPYVNIAATIGFIKGNPDGTFRPNALVTRAEFATMLVRFLGLQTKAGATVTATDVLGQEWYADSAKIALSHGLFPGDPKHFYPERITTRSNAIIALYEFILEQGK